MQKQRIFFKVIFILIGLGILIQIASLIFSSQLRHYRIGYLINQLQSENDITRNSAESELYRICDSTAVVPLTDCLKSKNTFVRSASLRLLGNIRDKRAVDPIIICLNDSQTDIRLLAAEALGQFGDKRAVEPLIKCLKDEKVVSIAAESLGKIGDKRAVDPLLALLNDSQNQYTSVIEALGSIGDSRAVDPLITYLAHQLDKLSGIPKQYDIDFCTICLMSLANIGDKKVIPVLVSFLPNWDANLMICAALTKLGWVPTSDNEKIYLWISVKDKRKLLINWGMTKQVLLRDIRSRNRMKIKNAVFTFISLGEKEILVELTNILEKEGNLLLANKYLKCGNFKLSEEEVKWGSKLGYSIVESGTAYKTDWNSWK